MQPFVWGKKLVKDDVKGSHSEGNKRLVLMNEIEKVRKRRLDRENELEEVERLRSEEQRLRETVQYEGWQRKEEDFHLLQTEERSKIRLLSKRERPIDIIARNVLFEEVSKKNIHHIIEGELSNPITVVEDIRFDKKELVELIEGVDSYLHLEMSRSGIFVEFWQCLLLFIQYTLRTVNRDSSSSAHHETIRDDVEDLLRRKSQKELKLLQQDILQNLSSGVSTDLEYWELMKEEVTVQLAKATIMRIHKEQVKIHLEMMSEWKTHFDNQFVGDDKNETHVILKKRSSDLFPDSVPDIGSSDQMSNDSIVETKMDDRDEVQLSGVIYSWQDKHHPRKPRYFNRVKTGWDWNKYNQTHYDFDNPPPKIVQGYKFTLFYPDLIDQGKTPKYFLEPCSEEDGTGHEKDFVIMRFHAGPPYEDVAFKIVNKEWDVNRRAGFVCVFERGILQLHFNFRRAFYRR